MHDNGFANLACASAEQDHLERLQNDEDIEYQTSVLHVKQIILKLFDRILFRSAVGIT
jgi:hypothetical protein